MSLNFPASPSNNQVYFDAISGNRYTYNAVNNVWFYTANNAIQGNAQDGQIVFDDAGSANGNPGLTFNKTANTLTANTINAYSMRVTGNLYIGSNTVVISNNSISAEMINVTTVMVAGAAIPSGTQSNAMYDLTNAAFGHTNTTLTHSQAVYGAVNSVFGVANAAFGSANNVAPQVAPAFNTANAAYGSANASYVVANASFGHSNITYAAVNSAFAVINAAFTSANNVAPQVAPAFNTANAAYNQANTGTGIANYGAELANANYTRLTAAFNTANTKFSSSGGTVTGSVSIVGDLVISGNTIQVGADTLRVSDPLIYLAGNNYSSDIIDIGFIANYVNTAGANVHTGLYREHENKEYYLFQGYDQEPINNHIGAMSNNMTLSVLNADIRTSNLNLGGANAITWISSGYGVANAAFGHSNTTYGAVNSAFGVANAAYGLANSNSTRLSAAYVVANAAFGVANGALTTSNYSSYALPLSGGTVTGSTTISTGTNKPLTLTTSSSGPWALDLYRSDIDSHAMVFNNGYWYFNLYCYAPSFRAPIFYDSDNTGYYLDPASTSNFNALQTYSYQGNGNVGGTGSAAWFPSGLYSASGAQCWIYGNINRGGADTTNGGAYYGTIYYDNNDSGYYVDPNSTSKLLHIDLPGKVLFPSGASGTTFGANHYSMGKDIANGGWSDPHYSDLIIGYHTGIRIGAHYSGTRFYSNSPTTDANNDGNGDGGETLIMTVGGHAGGHSYVIAHASMRSPIFYDYNDTGYYMDPNSTSSLNTANYYNLNYQGNTDYGFKGTNVYADTINSGAVGDVLELCYHRGAYTTTSGSMRAPIFYDSDNTGYYFGGNSGILYSSQSYADDWFRAVGGCGLYFESYGYGIRSAHGEGNSYGNITTYGTGRNGWTGYGFASRACIMTDLNTGGGTFGLHDNSYGWVWRWIPDSYFTVDRGYSVFNASARAPIFYDSNDTGYYCDPNSYSSFNTLRCHGNEMYLRGGSPTLHFEDTDQQCATLHNNSNLFYILRHNSYTVGWSTVGSGWWPMTVNLTNNDVSWGGNISAAYNVSAYASDRRLKENIKEIPNAIEKIKAIRGVTFDWNDKADEVGFKPEKKYNDIGCIAQEVEAILPHVVTLAPFDRWKPGPNEKYSNEYLAEKMDTSRSGENYLTIQYDRMVPLLIQAIKEQQEQIEELKRRL